MDRGNGWLCCVWMALSRCCLLRSCISHGTSHIHQKGGAGGGTILHTINKCTLGTLWKQLVCGDAKIAIIAYFSEPRLEDLLAKTFQLKFLIYKSTNLYGSLWFGLCLHVSSNLLVSWLRGGGGCSFFVLVLFRSSYPLLTIDQDVGERLAVM